MKLNQLAIRQLAIRSQSRKLQDSILHTAAQNLIDAYDRNDSKFGMFIGRLRDALGGSEVPSAGGLKVKGYLFSRPGLVKIDTSPHGGDWRPLVDEEEHKAAMKNLKLDLAKEVLLLRDVYESARSMLRFYGVDNDKAIEAGARLDTSIEAVKNFDGGTDE